MAEGNIGDAYLALDRDDEALKIFQKQNHYIRLGRYYLKQNKFPEAKQQFGRELGKNIQRREAVFMVSGWIGLGIACEGKNEYQQAKDNYKKAVEFMERQRESLPEAARTHFLAATVFDFPRIEAYEGLARVSEKLGQPQEAFYWAENTRARLLAEQIAGKHKAGSFQIPSNLAEKEQELIKKIASNYKQQDIAFQKKNKELLNRLEQEIEPLKQKQKELVERLRKDYPQYAAVRYPQPVKAEYVPIKENEVILEYEVTEPYTLCMVVRSGKVEKIITIKKTRQELEQMVRRYREPFGPGHDIAEYSHQLSYELYNLLLKDALADIATKTRLIIVPDEFLSLVPFDSLTTQQPQQEDKPVVVAKADMKRGLVSRNELVRALSKKIIRRRGFKVELPRVGVPILFEFDSNRIKNDSNRQLQEIIAALTSSKLSNNRFRIEGHTDAVGDEDYNLKLSRDRAKSVREYLTTKGNISPPMLFATGYGETHPIASNDSTEGQAQNRRVEIVRLPDREKEAALPKKSAKTSIPIKTYVSDYYPVSYYQSATVISLNRKLKKSRSPNKQLFALGDAIYGKKDIRAGTLLAKRGAMTNDRTISILQKLNPKIIEEQLGYYFPRLENTRLEVEAVGKLFPVNTLLLGEDASEEKVKSSTLDRYRYVLFSTHGILGNDIPYIKEPALVLNLVGNKEEDGFLTMSEIFNMKLDADLVTLSACQTGLGTQVAGEGLMGLSRAFMYAGTDTVIATLWSVADDSTAKFMVKFFELVKSGKDKLTALREAKVYLRNNGYDHPFYWAPFILIGEQ